MTSELLRLILWFTALSLVLAYALWVKLRVVLLRQALFEIRDDMFDQVAALGRLDDPAYLVRRASINSVIRISGTLTPVTIAYLVGTATPADMPTSTDKNVQDVLLKTHDRVVRRLTRYISRETLTGVLLFCLLRVLPKGVRDSEVKKGVDIGLRPIPKLDARFCSML